MKATTSIKDELQKRLEVFLSTLDKIERMLNVYRDIEESRRGEWIAWLRKLFPFRQRMVDRRLAPAGLKCKKYLEFNYQRFYDAYAAFGQMNDSTQRAAQKLLSFRILSSLDFHVQDMYKKLFMLLSFWEINEHDRFLPRSETIRAVRNCAGYEQTVTFFNHYLREIRKGVFAKSRLIKKQFRLIFMDKSVRQPLLDNLEGYVRELNTLQEVVEKYRRFHHQTDPQPKKGYGKRRRRKEANYLSTLHRLEEEIRVLQLLTINFHATLESEPSLEKKVTPSISKLVNDHLHEMSQPLASRELLKRHATALLHILHGLDELASFDPQVITFTRMVLIKAMCYDWKYHVMHEIPHFEHLVDIHHNICAIEQERQHANRLHKFQRVLDQIKLCIDKGETLRHFQEIEHDVNDIRAYLQDFFAHVKRLDKEQEDIVDVIQQPNTKAYQALMDYLFLFGKFFHSLDEQDPEQRMIRKQMLFVDQYLEEIEWAFNEIMPWGRMPR